MLSKFSNKLMKPLLSVKRVFTNPQTVSGRVYTDLVPPSQYDTPFPNRLKFGYVIKNYWETIPLFVTTALALGVVLSAIIWACRNKVDVVFSTHSRDNISRTMDLRNPSVHKILTINQQYVPWPEMQDVLDKMISAEKRALVRAKNCDFP